MGVRVRVRGQGLGVQVTAKVGVSRFRVHVLEFRVLVKRF